LATSPKPLNSRNPELPLQPEDAAETRLETAASANSAPQLQSWYELPQEIRMRLSLPRLDLHVYSEEPQNRFILVNLQKYREGETLESGLVLEEILPEGMVMSYLGERFMVEK
jgi:general secretion pathway protein B